MQIHGTRSPVRAWPHGVTTEPLNRKDDSVKKLFLAFGLLIASFTALGADMSNGADNFYKSDKVTT